MGTFQGRTDPPGEPLARDDPRRIGPYRLARRLGAGGMGVVYAGVDRAGQRVAVKVIHRELAHDPEFRARFAREVALLRRVDGACTARVLAADPDAARPWLATEYVSGPTLARHVQDGGALSGQELKGLAAGLAEALRALHAVNVVHRDLKPSNVILSPSGPKLVDMGIARALEETGVTRTGVVVGSPGWISPEEYRGDEIGPATDLYGWGLLVLHAATGRLPFGTGRPEVLALRVLSEEPAGLGDLPEPLRGLAARALAKNPGERPEAADVLGEVIGTDGSLREASALPEAGAPPEASTAREASAAAETSVVPETSAGPETSVVPGASATADTSVVPEASVLPEVVAAGGGGDLTEQVTRLLDRTWVMPAEAEPEWAVPAPPRSRRALVLAAAGVLLVLVIVAGVITARLLGPPNDARPQGVTQAAASAAGTRTTAATPATTRPDTSTAVPTTPEVAGRRAETVEGYAFLLPTGWQTIDDIGASGGVTCAHPPGSDGCGTAGIRLMFGIEPDEHFNLDDGSLAADLICPIEDDDGHAWMEQRELRRNPAYAYEYRTFRVSCGNQDDLTATFAYFPDVDNLIIAHNVPDTHAAAVIASFGSPATPDASAEDPPGRRQALDELLDASENSRKKLSDAIALLSGCERTGAAYQALQSARDERRAESALAAPAGGSSLETDALPDGHRLRLLLHDALNASYDAAASYTRWARGYIAAGCQETDASKPAYDQAVAHSGEATRHKQAFVELWNPIARDHGLPTREAGKI